MSMIAIHHCDYCGKKILKQENNHCRISKHKFSSIAESLSDFPSVTIEVSCKIKEICEICALDAVKDFLSKEIKVAIKVQDNNDKS